MVIKEWDGRKPIILCGPYCGEFGWELMYWRTKALRMLSLHPYHHRIIVADRGHQCLYAGKYDEYWSIKNLPGGRRKGCFLNKGWEWGLSMALLKHLKPQTHLPAWSGFEGTGTEKEVRSTSIGRVQLAKANLQDPFFVIFPRGNAKGGRRSLAKPYWMEMIKQLTKLGMVINSGRREDSLFDLPNVVHTESIAGDPRFELDVTVAALERAKAAICTDSGGMHIALHTKAKTIVIRGLTRFPRRREPDANVETLEGVLKCL